MFKIKIATKQNADIAVQWLYAYDIAYSQDSKLGEPDTEQYYRVFECFDRRGKEKVAGIIGSAFYRLYIDKAGDIIIPENKQL